MYYGLVVPPQKERLKREFEILTYIFDWVGIHTNFQKMVIITC